MTSDTHSAFVGPMSVIDTGRRRRWTAAQKAAIVEESFTSTESVSTVARRHNISPSQLFGWRRDALSPPAAAPPLDFAPVVLTGGTFGSSAPGSPVMMVELAGGGRVVIGREASAAQIAAALQALRA